MMKTTALVMGLTLSGLSLACGINGGGFLPENDLNIPANAKGINGGITEAEFNASIDKVENIYKSIVTTKGGNLVINRKWSDGTVNAYAQQSGKTWSVAMFGGLARHETITSDGMSLVVCHEIGHHIGGAPKIGGSGGGGWWGGGSSNNWASNEGQSDYFSGLKCLRRAFESDDNAAIVAGLNAPQALVDACTSAKRGDLAETNLCIRIGMAGKSVANLFSALSKLPDAKFDSPDSKVVSATNDSHPKAQCRLDTYFQGALCEVKYSEDVSNSDEATGTCTSANGFKEGNRPLCWFKPKQ